MAENLSTRDYKQYIIVELGNEQYGIDIQYIDNIVRMQRITRVPMAQSYFKGVINLRGEVIPVMSLRLKFDFEEDVFTGKTRILIVKPDFQASVGIIVDNLIGQQEIVIKSIGKYINNSKMISGATILGDGEVALILDVNTLV